MQRALCYVKGFINLKVHYTSKSVINQLIYLTWLYHPFVSWSRNLSSFLRPQVPARGIAMLLRSCQHHGAFDFRTTKFLNKDFSLNLW
jgi:hypothetical protein